MTELLLKRDQCRLCSGPELDLVIRLVPTPVGDAYVSYDHVDQAQETHPLELYLCRGCSHLQLLDVVDPEVLYGDFRYTTSISAGLPEHFRKYALDVLGNSARYQDALVVDIGSNDGTLLKFFKERGMRVLGVDPARDIADKATAAGIETLPVCFTDELAQRIKRDWGPATIITANNTFANVDDLADLSEGIRTLLAQDGVFLMETGYMVDLIQNRIIDNIYHEHLGYFSVKPLASFLTRQGLQLTEVERVDTKGGSLRAVVQLAGSQRPVSPSVGELIGLEASLAMDRPEPFKAFAAKISNVRDQLGSLLRGFMDDGKTIAGYGASVGTTTMVYHFKFGEILSFIVDDNPAKPNLFSPGHHIPVLDATALYEKKPDYVVILAWRYAQTIMEKHRSYLDAGGHFIIPLPEVVVV